MPRTPSMKSTTLLLRALWAIITAAPLLTLQAHALSTADWRKQSIYQVLTDRFARTDGSTSAPCELSSYCGGTWRGLASHLDYIQGMGFTAVWISPVVANLAGTTPYGAAYHGYWAQDIYSLNANFGTADDLLHLSAALHARGMYLMVDVVTNHMGYDGCGACVDYGRFTPFNSSDYYHPFCMINYDDDNSVRTCWEGDDVVSLPDLRTERQDVRDVFGRWIKELVQKYGIDGLRIDSAKHVEMDFWAPFEEASGVFNIGEVYDGDPNHIYPWLKAMSGVMNYPMFYWITRAFQSPTSTMAELVTGINQMKSAIDTSTLGSFTENHDQKRFPALTPDLALAKNAIALALLADGIPVVYQGQEQHLSGGDNPANREALWSAGYNTGSALYGHIAVLNRVRSLAAAQAGSYVGYQAWPIFQDDHTVALRKGVEGAQIIGVYTNVGTGGVGSSVRLEGSKTGFAAGAGVVDVLSCEAYSVGADGSLSFQMGGAPKVFYLGDKLGGSGICGK